MYYQYGNTQKQKTMKTFKELTIGTIVIYNDMANVVAESVDNIIEKTVNNCVQKDWTHRVYGESLCDVFEKVEKHLFG